jgi:hypothetical protein
MVIIYVRRINEGLMTIDEVPVRWKDTVTTELTKVNI